MNLREKKVQEKHEDAAELASIKKIARNHAEAMEYGTEYPSEEHEDPMDQAFRTSEPV